jgi:hypothetical protein
LYDTIVVGPLPHHMYYLETSSFGRGFLLPNKYGDGCMTDIVWQSMRNKILMLQHLFFFLLSVRNNIRMTKCSQTGTNFVSHVSHYGSPYRSTLQGSTWNISSFPCETTLYDMETLPSIIVSNYGGPSDPLQGKWYMGIVQRFLRKPLGIFRRPLRIVQLKDGMKGRT